MKLLKAVSVVFLMSSPLLSVNVHANEVCRLLESDSDGDGWGWEAGASCRITAETGVTPQMNHPRTGEPLNIERIFWVWEDFSGKTFSECQGYIVDPSQARDICSTCVQPVASLLHGPDGSGVYTRREDSAKALAKALKTDLAIAAEVIDTDTDGGATDTDGGATDTDGGATDTDGGATDTDGGATDTDGGATDTDGGATDTDGGATDTDGGATDTDGGATDTDGGTTDTDGGATDTDGGATDTDGGTTDTDGGNTDADGGNADTDGGNADTDGGNADTDGGNAEAGDGAGSGPIALQASFEWTVDNLGLYAGALAIDFYGERTEEGVRYWEVSDPGQIGFYTLCEAIPSSMGSMSSASSDNGEDQNATACIDTDGDGYGWDGSATCIP